MKLETALRHARPGADARRAAEWARFQKLGLPDRRVESWRWTDLKPLNDLEFAPSSTPWNGLDLGLDAERIGIMDGRAGERWSIPGLSVMPLQIAAAEFGERLDAHFAQPPASAAGLGALNAALSADGVVVHVTGRPLRPLHLDFHASGKTPNWHARSLILVEKDAHLELIETHSGPPDGRYFNHQGFDVVLKDGASLHHWRLEQDAPEAVHIADLSIRLSENAHYESCLLSIGAQLSRTDSALSFAGPNARAKLNAAYLCLRRRHVDVTSLIEHRAGSCVSEQVVKGVVDRGRGVFRGKIHVAPGADKTDGRQLTKALLLSDRGEVDHKPELEIFADDVKCAHGATVGDLDAAALFYLRARGIPEQEARMMLIRAFLEEALDALAQDGFKQTLLARIEAETGVPS